MNDNEVVWLTEYRTFGFLLKEGAYTSTVAYWNGEELVEENIENDEYENWNEHSIDYESE